MRANQLLKDNIDTLLRKRGESRKALAQWCYRSESWISKVFKEARREFSIKDLDRISDFFGVATYQLFQPGISAITERRKGDRRTGRERRISQAQRLMQEVGAELSRASRTSLQAVPKLPLSDAHQQTLAASYELLERLSQLTPEMRDVYLRLLDAKAPPDKRQSVQETKVPRGRR